MDAVEFIKAIKRRAGTRRGYFRIDAATDPDALVQDMEQWVLEHPRKTRQSEFLKQWPNAKIGHERTVAIDPCIVDATMRNDRCLATSCGECRREFWMQGVE